ncbi:MAG: hypothetical protein A2808_00540 [Candidatus Moranbacteria bacterium RIFCSPHIGHO2_01_FULL_55_24]|nr:MAG: hypothetical protein A2808_00540 [Candidatus Moranbacteria bacterium RIFCSPHIGHO2_01_FULL_55_24]
MEPKTPLTPEQRIQNLSAIVILLFGLFAGSLFVDFVQLATGQGFSRHVVRDYDVLETPGKTWVAFKDPKVSLQIVTEADCEACSPKEALVWLRRVIPTLEASPVEAESELGQALIKRFHITSLPAFIFSDGVTKTDFYAQAQSLFQEQDNRYAFNMAPLGLPAGKYLEAPSIEPGDIVLGDQNAPLKVFVYTDFQCEYCKQFHKTLEDARKKHGKDVAFVYRHLPLSFHAQAENAAVAAQCAAEQGKFPEYANQLFARQNEWGNQSGQRWFTNAAWQLRLDGRRFEACLGEEKQQDKLRADALSAENYGISGTPSTFVGDTLLNGAVDAATLEERIAKALPQGE